MELSLKERDIQALLECGSAPLLCLASLKSQKDQCSLRSRASFYVDQPISYWDFFINYMSQNKLCVLGKWISSEWSCFTTWVTEDGKPNFDTFLSNYGDAVCPVANCNAEQHMAHPKCDMKLEEFIESTTSPGDQCLYLKDWHFLRDFPNADVYKLPEFFQSDWLNEFWKVKHKEDDYRFVYFGPKGSWTPFHADVFRSYSWSANVCGRKKWWLYPPGTENKLKCKLGSLPFDLRDTVNFDHSDRIEVIQEPGEIIFVPSGWYHQVFNEECTISINHNWINGCNIDKCWEHLRSSLCDVMREIDDCKTMDGWNQHCQVMLNANNGIDYKGFQEFLFFIAKRRCEHLLDLTIPLAQRYHSLFDLSAIHHTLTLMSQDEFVQELVCCDSLEPSESVCQEISKTLMQFKALLAGAE